MNKTVKIGNTEVGCAMLAPMAGMADGPFRLICRAHGAGYSTTEMISAKAVCFRDKKTALLAQVRPEEGPFAVQLFGSEPQTVAEAAKILLDMYRKAGTVPCAVDFNMGCPVTKIVRNGEGSALMQKPALAAQIISALVESSGGIPVTVKMRLGWDENNINVTELAKAAEDRGAAAVCVHARTRAQMYAPSADWTYIKQVKDTIKIPVIGNGDILSGADALRMMTETGCDAVAVGRGALGNPWIFDDINAALTGGTFTPPSKRDRIYGALRHLELAIEYKGERTAVLECRTQLAYYTKGLYGSPRVRNEINLANNYAEVKELLLSLLD